MACGLVSSTAALDHERKYPANAETMMKSEARKKAPFTAMLLCGHSSLVIRISLVIYVDAVRRTEVITATSAGQRIQLLRPWAL